jgi:glycolate oxidase
VALSSAIINQLRKIVDAKGVLTESIDLTTYSYDATTSWRSNPEVVLLPTTAEQVSQIMKLATEHNIPVTPRGAGSNLSGGSIPVSGGIVLCTTRMNRIVKVDTDNFAIKVEVGVVLNDMNKELTKYGLFFPPDPQSFLTATIGGCISENSGGPYAVKYGVFRQYLLGMTAVLTSGAIVKFGGNTVKNVTGYDLPQIICGSEGTLAVITEVTLRVIPRPPAHQTVLAVFDKTITAGKAVHLVLNKGILPAKIELMDNFVIRRIEEVTPLGLPLDAEAILLFELDGIPEAVEKETAGVVALCQQVGAINVHPARDARESDNYWAARRAGFSAVISMSPTVFSEDVTVPISQIPELIRRIQEIGKKYDVKVAILGHAGDGNLHPSVLTDKSKPEHYARAEKAVADIFAVALELDGCISGEHGIGLEKKPFLKQAMSPEAIDLLRGIKKVFDPKGILNPHKIWEEK